MKARYLGKIDTPALVKNKIYDVISVEKGWFRIMTELDEDYLFPPDQFEIVEKISSDVYKYIIKRVLERAFESINEPKDRNDFSNGRRLAYYEIADIIKSELYVRDVDLSEYGLDIDLENVFL